MQKQNAQNIQVEEEAHYTGNDLEYWNLYD